MSLSLQSFKFNCSVFFTKNIFLMSKQCNHSLRDVMTYRVVYLCGSGSIPSHFLSGIGICSKEGCWIELEFGSNVAFALGPSISFGECGSILNSWELGCSVRAESFPSSSWIRNFSIRSLTNLLSPFEILTKNCELSPDKDSWGLKSPVNSWLSLMVIGVPFTNPAFRFRG